jgi:hypothetical protein
MSPEGERGAGGFKPISFEPDYATPDMVGFTVMNNHVGTVIGEVMSAVPNVTVTFLPAMIRVEAVGLLEVVYDEIAEALGEEPGFFDAAGLEENISTCYGRIIHEEDRAIFFVTPEDVAARIAAETAFTAADPFEARPSPPPAAPAPPAVPDPFDDTAPPAVSEPSEDGPAPAAAIPELDEAPGGSCSGAVPRDAHQDFSGAVHASRSTFGVSTEGGDDAAPPHGPDPPGAGGPPGGRDSGASRRYLKGQCAETVPVGRPFSLLVSIVMSENQGSQLEPFGVPPQGRDVLLVAQAPKLRLLGDERQTVHVPAADDSRPVMFELRADEPGPRQVSVTAWIAGTWLGELQVEVAAEVDSPLGPHRDVLAEVTTEPVDGAVSLVVRYDPVAKAYRFEFRDEDNPDEVTSNLSYDPAPIVERLVADLNDLAKGRTGYSAAQTRDYLLNAGAQLWTELVPGRLREQFWERQQRIRQLTILADHDVVPWELLYPMDPGHDAGFLVEQFSVTRAIFRWRPARSLGLWPARFVLPERSLPEARAEVAAMQRLLDRGQVPSRVISALTPLQELIAGGNFGLLHFACHNTYSPAEGSSITLDNVNFTPTLLTTAVINKVLAGSSPTVFMNACRSAGLSATYNRLDGWASKFLEAGAGAFIGSLWAVSDGAAREFAEEFYGQFRAGLTLGEAVNRARKVASSQAGDPSWLAYTVYGNSRATVGGQPAGAGQLGTP